MLLKLFEECVNMKALLHHFTTFSAFPFLSFFTWIRQAHLIHVKEDKLQKQIMRRPYYPGHYNQGFASLQKKNHLPFQENTWLAACCIAETSYLRTRMPLSRPSRPKGPSSLSTGVRPASRCSIWMPTRSRFLRRFSSFPNTFLALLKNRVRYGFKRLKNPLLTSRQKENVRLKFY